METNYESPEEKLKKSQEYNELKYVNDNIFKNIINNSKLIESLELQSEEVNFIKREILNYKKDSNLSKLTAKNVKDIKDAIEKIPRNLENQISSNNEKISQIINHIEQNERENLSNLDKISNEIENKNNEIYEITRQRFDEIEQKNNEINKEINTHFKNNNKLMEKQISSNLEEIKTSVSKEIDIIKDNNKNFNDKLSKKLNEIENNNSNLQEYLTKDIDSINNKIADEVNNIKESNKNNNIELKQSLKAVEDKNDSMINKVKEDFISHVSQSDEKFKKGFLTNTIIGILNFIILLIVLILHFV